MIKGDAIIAMMIVGGNCNNRDHAIRKIAHELDLSVEQVERLLSTSGFKNEELQRLCDICGYLVALIPKAAFSTVPLVLV